MEIQDLYTKTYYRIVGQSKILSGCRFFIRRLANIHVPLYFNKRSSYKCSYKGGDVIVSMTSYPARINSIWIVIETLLRQSVVPRKICLWLSLEQFPDRKLPENLLKLQERGLEIRFVEGDIRSHKKYYYVFQEYPNDLIMLADDDIIYPSDLIESLLKARKSLKAEKVVAHKYGYRMKWDDDGQLLPYNNWGSYYSAYTGDDLFFGSGGGTLVRPSDFYKDVLNLDLALELCPKADDIWLNAMAKLGGCKYIKVKDGPILSVQNRNDAPLYKDNLSQNLNDIQIKSVQQYYKSLSLPLQIFCHSYK